MHSHFRHSLLPPLACLWLAGLTFNVYSTDQDLLLHLPVDCTPGVDCWVVNYMDMDPAADSSTDFTCGSLTYDRHKGTDFAIRDRRVMQQGVNVLAAVPGTVTRVRDGMSDRDKDRADLDRIRKRDRDCGNGIMVDIGGGWETLYCHLQRDSIRVAEGDVVGTGQVLGRVGQSGYAEFPHLHLSLFYQGKPVDPWTGATRDAGCGVRVEPFWHDTTQLDYRPLMIYASGFSDSEPRFSRVKQDATSPAELPVDIGKLLFWTAFFGAQEGDRVTLRVRDPRGRVLFRQQYNQGRTRARQFYYAGKRVSGRKLPAGVYTGTVRIERSRPDGSILRKEKTTTVTLKSGVR